MGWICCHLLKMQTGEENLFYFHTVAICKKKLQWKSKFNPKCLTVWGKQTTADCLHLWKVQCLFSVTHNSVPHLSVYKRLCHKMVLGCSRRNSVHFVCIHPSLNVHGCLMKLLYSETQNQLITV